MQISMQLNYAGGYRESAALVAEYEKAGLDMVWIAEAYGFDGVSMMGYLAATTDTITIWPVRARPRPSWDGCRRAGYSGLRVPRRRRREARYPAPGVEHGR